MALVRVPRTGPRLSVRNGGRADAANGSVLNLPGDPERFNADLDFDCEPAADRIDVLSTCATLDTFDPTVLKIPL